MPEQTFYIANRPMTSARPPGHEHSLMAPLDGKTEDGPHAEPCHICHGSGRVDEWNLVHVRAHQKGPGYELLSVHCEACDGTGLCHE